MLNAHVSFSYYRTEKGSPGGSPGGGSPGGSSKRLRKPYNTKTFKVELNFATKIPMSSIVQAMKGHESENSQEAFRVLDIILRQHSASQYDQHLTHLFFSFKGIFLLT